MCCRLAFRPSCERVVIREDGHDCADPTWFLSLKTFSHVGVFEPWFAFVAYEQDIAYHSHMRAQPNNVSYSHSFHAAEIYPELPTLRLT